MKIYTLSGGTATNDPDVMIESLQASLARCEQKLSAYENGDMETLEEIEEEEELESRRKLRAIGGTFTLIPLLCLLATTMTRHG